MTFAPPSLALNGRKGIRTSQNKGSKALLWVGDRSWSFDGHWIQGGPWERFGRYDCYVVIRGDGAVMRIPAHAGELVPGSTEDLIAVLRRYDHRSGSPPAPMTLELDPTYRCTSRDCGGRCFSAAYRRLAPTAAIPAKILRDLLTDFAGEGGRIVRFDGGGDPLAHPAVRGGELPELAATLGLKSTILTSGDLLPQADLQRIGSANCYLRVSLNAGTNDTRRRFHGNKIALDDIFSAIERFAGCLARANPAMPIGATFLLDVSNYREVLACAQRARDCGVSHFSVRRILGPPTLRPVFSAADEEEIGWALESVRALGNENFRLFLPWRPLNEADVNPAQGELGALRCWQSTLKAVIEPDHVGGGFCVQLCGRYRGGGAGQSMQMPKLLASQQGRNWVASWRKSFRDYRWPREILPNICVSCIDRGFIRMVDGLVGFLGDQCRGFHILHLQSSEESKLLPERPVEPVADGTGTKV